MNYPYRECACGRQIHVGGTYLCVICKEKEASDIEEPELAFPQSFSGGRFTGGMTLRDYFATKALQGLLANTKITAHILKDKTLADVTHTWYAGVAYQFADMMLERRGRQDD